MDLRAQMEAISSCTCRITELYADWARLHGMSYNTMMTLYALTRQKACTQKQISAEWLIPKQTVNTVIKDLERKGYVQFSPGRDQKEKMVAFTPAGQLYANDCLREILELEDRVLSRMGPDLVRAMLVSSQAFAAALAQEVAHGA